MFFMKNRQTLVIASVFLVLCVAQKEARYKALRIEKAEKIYNIPVEDINKIRMSGQKLPGTDYSVPAETKAQMVELTSLDSTLNTFTLNSENVANVSSKRTILGNYAPNERTEN
jgi:hypothetical protein